jgi:hypothetical protein
MIYDAENRSSRLDTVKHVGWFKSQIPAAIRFVTLGFQASTYKSMIVEFGCRGYIHPWTAHQLLRLFRLVGR